MNYQQIKNETIQTVTLFWWQRKKMHTVKELKQQLEFNSAENTKPWVRDGYKARNKNRLKRALHEIWQKNEKFTMTAS